jgi:hypothetical protein
VSIKPEFAFDIAFEIYQTLKAEQEAVGLLDAGTASDHCWRPRSGAGNSEYIADFALAIRAPFKESYEASRRILIELFYISLVPYEQARHRMGISAYIWSVWTEEIRKEAGKSLMQRGLFPPKSYFGERTRQRRPQSGTKSIAHAVGNTAAKAKTASSAI